MMTLDLGDVIGFITLLITIGGVIFKFGMVSQELKDLKKAHADEKAANKEAHDKLFAAKDDMSEILTRLTTLFESMTKKQDQMEKKLEDIQNLLLDLVSRKQGA